MSGALNLIFRRIAVIVCGAFLVVMASGCDNGDISSSESVTTQHEGWPRTVQTAKGPLTLSHPPQRIASTSVTITGSLLAINAPVIASGATSPSSNVADNQGFFSQWSKEAAERGVKPLYITEPNAEAVAAVSPDLIVIAATGGDSALKLYDQLTTIAPTLVIDYGDKSWQQLARQLGIATGHEADADSVIAQFEQRVRAVKQAITLPPQPVSAVVYYEDGRGVNIWTKASAQGQLLTELGFQLATLPEGIKTETKQGKRQDIVQISGESTAESLNGKSLLLFSADDSIISAVLGNPFLSHLEPVRERTIWAMGTDTFRLDYYSASNMLSNIERHFATR
ncbi:iron complex transport system substrate-binding protein|uniref:Iron complex transport system substrate-binding protein n=1 Tax=Brenneria salicis ATCC 15712 = DSM 30166 TaxID=714314 RepID=A0A366I2U0_9GAMM|nr:Fe2+-enterobactin ABC transporter substrate-binding protein [Brenneria salicis]NMN92980.1 iron complex transport system substrate-binding protein [Brenneria salicis ATCC 15712 = DSM 30166]RBP61953.1 iron complex transport system substrate-binding protein [Brenneria salicis ATCC 15712 = DSM 30166]RLM31242.1 Fe2+-enterobactin ABC transporter substrate-binding protein [Brenneria salicis ATCC 15712 = DSM 30166]